MEDGEGDPGDTCGRMCGCGCEHENRTSVISCSPRSSSQSRMAFVVFCELEGADAASARVFCTCWQGPNAMVSMPGRVSQSSPNRGSASGHEPFLKQ